MNKNLDITKPRYTEQILPVPWLLQISTLEPRYNDWFLLIPEQQKE